MSIFVSSRKTSARANDTFFLLTKKIQRPPHSMINDQTNKLESLKKEKSTLEKILLRRGGETAADESYQALKPYFDEIYRMHKYNPVGRIRLARLFLESDLSEDKELFSCYGRFVNLAEGQNT